MAKTSNSRDMLRGAALRVTRPRLAVLNVVLRNPHVDTESIIGDLRTTDPDVSRQSVYNTLRTLTDAGLLRRIQPARSLPRYETRIGDNHHHVVCRSCGLIADVDCAIGESPCLIASDAGGFSIDEAEVIYWGRCPACSAPQGL
jgi:Fur family transcriptional regulator, stress-responsive regulator